MGLNGDVLETPEEYCGYGIDVAGIERWKLVSVNLPPFTLSESGSF
jgi:hypothetical protein